MIVLSYLNKHELVKKRMLANVSCGEKVPVALPQRSGASEYGLTHCLYIAKFNDSTYFYSN